MSKRGNKKVDSFHPWKFKKKVSEVKNKSLFSSFLKVIFYQNYFFIYFFYFFFRIFVLKIQILKVIWKKMCVVFLVTFDIGCSFPKTDVRVQNARVGTVTLKLIYSFDFSNFLNLQVYSKLPKWRFWIFWKSYRLNSSLNRNVIITSPIRFNDISMTLNVDTVDFLKFE